MLQQRQSSIGQSFQEIKSKTTPTQSRIIFENLAILQTTIHNHQKATKHSYSTQPHSQDLASQQDSSSQSSKKKTCKMPIP
jgi:hypothetical protein